MTDKLQGLSLTSYTDKMVVTIILDKVQRPHELADMYVHTSVYPFTVGAPNSIPIRRCRCAKTQVRRAGVPA